MRQTVDLVKAGVSDEYKTNMAINIVLGENVKRDTVPLISDDFNLISSHMCNPHVISLLHSEQIWVKLGTIPQMYKTGHEKTTDICQSQILDFAVVLFYSTFNSKILGS